MARRKGSSPPPYFWQWAPPYSRHSFCLTDRLKVPLALSVAPAKGLAAAKVPDHPAAVVLEPRDALCGSAPRPLASHRAVCLAIAPRIEAGWLATTRQPEPRHRNEDQIQPQTSPQTPTRKPKTS